jgi:hypothetical protein
MMAVATSLGRKLAQLEPVSPATTRRCEWCATPFEPHRGHHIFCDAVCRGRACMHRFITGQNMTRDVACAECGTVFSAVRRDRKFCGKRCCQRWHDRRRQPRVASQQPSPSPQRPSR